MIDKNKIRQGLEVFTEDDQPLGTIERVQGNEFYMNGRSYPLSVLTRFERNRLYVGGNAYKDYAQSGTEATAIPVTEERLNVEKRGGQVGEVAVHKTVTTEQQQVPVELRHEEVDVQQRKVAERPLQSGETAFQEGVIRVPLYGEEAVVSKQAVVTGEVEINKQQKVERQQIRDSVRKEHIDVDRTGAQQANLDAATQPLESAGNQGYYNTENTQLRDGMEVISSDGQKLGKVKDLNDSTFTLGRGIFKQEVEVDQRSITNINDDQVEVNFTKEYVDNLM